MIKLVKDIQGEFRNTREVFNDGNGDDQEKDMLTNTATKVFGPSKSASTGQT